MLSGLRSVFLDGARSGAQAGRSVAASAWRAGPSATCAGCVFSDRFCRSHCRSDRFCRVRQDGLRALRVLRARIAGALQVNCGLRIAGIAGLSKLFGLIVTHCGHCGLCRCIAGNALQSGSFRIAVRIAGIAGALQSRAIIVPNSGAGIVKGELADRAWPRYGG